MCLLVPLLCTACSHRIRSRSLVQASFSSRLTAWSVYVSWVFLFLNQISKHRPLSPLFWVRPISDVLLLKNGRWHIKIQQAVWKVCENTDKTPWPWSVMQCVRRRTEQLEKDSKRQGCTSHLGVFFQIRGFSHLGATVALTWWLWLVPDCFV